MLVGLLALGGQAFAELCTIDAVPAATLLLPYFEVDLDNPDGVNTLFSVNNASAAPALAHVTFWTNFSIPTVDFDMYLTGYDVITVNLRDVIENGNIPITADAPSDPGDAISPHRGTFSNNPQWDGLTVPDFGLGTGDGFPGCTAFFPFFNNPVLTGNALCRLQNGHTGGACNGECFGRDLGDNVARGYITVDNVNRCSTDFPSDPNYFGDGGTGVANNNNQLWGDYFYINEAENFAQGENLVHVEARDGFYALPPDGDTGYTFYGRYTIPAFGLGVDNREPLGTTWAARYLNGGQFDGGTDLIVWRDSVDNYAAPSSLVCIEVLPPWLVLDQTEVVAFNEREDAVEICFGGFVSPPEDVFCFPLETQKLAVGAGDLAIPFNFGWMYLNLNHTNGLGLFGAGGDIAQSYVTVNHDALGRFSVGLAAIELTSACDDVSPSIVNGSRLGVANDVPGF
jgi:hypothetical protein